MTPHISRPAIALPGHQVSTDDICDDIRAHHPRHPRLESMVRVARATGVRSRRFTRPLHSPTVSGTAAIEERNNVAFADSARLAEQAAREALAGAGLEPSAIDCVVTSHTTSWVVPGLDIHLIGALGLRPDVRRVPMSSLGCVGGAQALVRAADHVRAHPGSRVLVVVAETISTLYNHRNATFESMIYKALFGDGAGACLVTDVPLGPGLRVDDTWEYLLPDSHDCYWGRLDGDGLHFDSTRAATEATADVMPALCGWLDPRGTADGPAWAIVHPGGPRVLDDCARGLGLGKEVLRHSWNSLRENGNLGGVAVLDVLARTHDDPPGDGASGVLLAFGPGFTAAACRGTWCA
ncbi:type III polyketide synthase [Streptomyces sp. ISL-11]|uniref:type III polyketide synthase n=1 Tax=Streptomyces sp. ISL-11 TaxID=2819174 RepID=UPI001BE7F8AD|nr:type III polyketide synthase [Streptomyces sp. ISL-11]MBT2386057.1 type III polyketide synthase [Streptomyces sp. ISL-11]